MNSLNFNIDNGYLEGLVRGFKAGILKQSDYANLVQCETLEGKYLSIVSIYVSHTGHSLTSCLVYINGEVSSLLT